MGIIKRRYPTRRLRGVTTTGIGIVKRKYCRNSVQICNNQLLCTKVLRSIINLWYTIPLQLVTRNDVTGTTHVNMSRVNVPICVTSTEHPATSFVEHRTSSYELQHTTQLQSSDTFSHQYVPITRMCDMWLEKCVGEVRCFVQA
jgi:hypothetical protein